MLNVNCWSKNNCDLRKKILNEGDPDIICITETHLKNYQIIAMSGFKSYNLNRKIESTKSHKGSGGVCILIKYDLLEEYKVVNVTCIDESILGVDIECKVSSEKISIFCVYLSPENSRYGTYNEQLLNKLLIETYARVDSDFLIICGDFNTRIGDKNDCNLCTDVPKRVSLDHQCNAQGARLLEFLNDTKCCILNGRVTSDLDNFTSITSYCGKAVVDYAITRVSELDSVKKCSVNSCIELINRLHLQNLIGPQCKIPDHSVINIELELSSSAQMLQDRNLGSKNYQNIKIPRKVSENYMKSDVALKVLPELMCQVEQVEKNQIEVDKCYDNIAKFLYDECERTNPCKSRKRRSTKRKEYWDLELSKAWRKMKECKKEYTRERAKCKFNNHVLGGKKANFRVAQKSFEKMVTKKRRAFCKGVLLQIEACNSRDPQSFWNYVKRIGPNNSKKSEIPWEVEVDSEITHEKDKVLEHWKNTFENLYNVNNVTFNDSFKCSCMNDNSIGTDNDVYSINENLNKNITLKEIESACKRAKAGKAVGIDIRYRKRMGL